MATSHTPRNMHEMLAAGLAVSSAAMHREQTGIKECVECDVPTCRLCNVAAGQEVREMANRVAIAATRSNLG